MEHVIRALIATGRDQHHSLFWQTSDTSRLDLFVNCNDVFFWACSDCAEITPENIEVFEKSMREAGDDGCILFCARVFGMRPQGAMYKYLNKDNWPLFDACGPEREVDFGNPEPHPSKEVLN